MAPLYSQIERDLVDKIERGEFAPGDPVPTEIELCAIYGVSRITVRRAVERLVATRMIYRKRGVGTFVAATTTDARSLRLTGRISDVLTFNQLLSTRVVKRGMMVAPSAIRDAFGSSDIKSLYAISGVNFLDGKPYAVTRSFIAPALAAIGPRIDMSEGRTSIRGVEELTDLRVRSGQQTIEPAIARGEVASQLGLKPGTAVLKALRVFFAAGEYPIEAVLVHYHPERYHIGVDLLASESLMS